MTSVFKDKFKLSVFHINHISENKDRQENTFRFNDSSLASFHRKELYFRSFLNQNNTFNLAISNKNSEKVDFYYQMIYKNSQIEEMQDKNMIFSNSSANYNGFENADNQMFNTTMNLDYILSKNHNQGWLVNFLYQKENGQNQTFADDKLFFILFLGLILLKII